MLHRTLSVITLLFLIAFSAAAQSVTTAIPTSPAPLDLPKSIYAAGLTFNPGGSPQIAGTGLVAKQLSANVGTYAFAVLDVIPLTYKPFNVSTGIGVGIAQYLFSVGKADFFIPTSAGVSYVGANKGWLWSTGALVSIPVGKAGWQIQPNVRAEKSSIVGQYQVMVGILIGFAK